MGKLGRNDPCRCGSGKKYKRCCLATDEAAREIARHRAERMNAELGALSREHDDDEDYLCPGCAEAELEELSNRVGALIRARQFDEAEDLCRELGERFPDRIDGTERLGQVYEARGEGKAAAREYRKAAERVLVTQDLADGARRWFLEQAERLDPGGQT